MVSTRQSAPSPRPRKRGSATGAVAANPHEGSRSEVLADYLFSGWGTVTPVRRQDDFGVDLYCTLTERVGRRAVVTDYYQVQVKSGDEWEFNDVASVKWLVEYPQPLFLASVDKRAGILRVHHVMPRFAVGTFPPLPDRLLLKSEDIEEGVPVDWSNGTEFSLSAPILRVTLPDLLDESVMVRLRKVFAEWVRRDRENCDLARQGLLRFRTPSSYRVNEMPAESIDEMGNAAPSLAMIMRGLLASAEAAECIGGQLARNGDRETALHAALFVNRVQQAYPYVFKGHVRWRQRLPADLGRLVCSKLNRPSEARYEGIDDVADALRRHPRVARFLQNAPQR